MRRWAIVTIAAAAVVGVVAAPAAACGGLLAPNGTINLVRTSTLAAYHDGVEHYVTGFEFAGAGGKFGSIIPLPAVPTKVIKGGDWTLQRLAIETQPQPVFATALADESAAAAPEAKVLLTAEIDALDLTVLEGGGDAVGRWAKENGFELPPDAPEVLDFYADRSPIFMAAKFNRERAERRGQQVGDSTPVHVVMPTDDPWVPLRILALGKDDSEIVDADVYLLTDRRPSMLPEPAVDAAALETKESGPASATLLRDLRSDRGMRWLPATDMWLTYLRVHGRAGQLNHDLAIDADGGRPSLVDAGLSDPPVSGVVPDADSLRLWGWALACGLAGLVVFGTDRLVAGRR